MSTTIKTEQTSQNFQDPQSLIWGPLDLLQNVPYSLGQVCGFPGRRCLHDLWLPWAVSTEHGLSLPLTDTCIRAFYLVARPHGQRDWLVGGIFVQRKSHASLPAGTIPMWLDGTLSLDT